VVESFFILSQGSREGQYEKVDSCTSERGCESERKWKVDVDVGYRSKLVFVYLHCSFEVVYKYYKRTSCSKGGIRNRSKQAWEALDLYTILYHVASKN
jgi:hypothetical protein